jgi:hypothetical protein
MEDEGLSSEEAAILAANEIVRHADKMIAAGASRNAADTWTQVVAVAYGARFDERIRGLQEFTELPRTEPQ